jgi:hypothetical protein
MSKTPPNTVTSSGAEPGDVLMGIHANSNRGMFVQIFEKQLPGYGGKIRGPFRILHEGKGKYKSGIADVMSRLAFWGRADDFLDAVNREPGCKDCMHVLNANALWRVDADLIYDNIVNIEFTNAHTHFVKRCGSCGGIYDDISLNFCLEDGTVLSMERAEVETIVSPVRLKTPASTADSEITVAMRPKRRRRTVPEYGYEYIRAAVAEHSELEMVVHPGYNHRIMKRGHVGSIWIIPRHGGVSITANGQSAARLYREMERMVGAHHRVDRKGYRYFQVDREDDLKMIIDSWAKF